MSYSKRTPKVTTNPKRQEDVKIPPPSSTTFKVIPMGPHGLPFLLSIGRQGKTVCFQQNPLSSWTSLMTQTGTLNDIQVARLIAKHCRSLLAILMPEWMTLHDEKRIQITEQLRWFEEFLSLFYRLDKSVSKIQAIDSLYQDIRLLASDKNSQGKPKIFALGEIYYDQRRYELMKKVINSIEIHVNNVIASMIVPDKFITRNLLNIASFLCLKVVLKASYRRCTKLLGITQVCELNENACVSENADYVKNNSPKYRHATFFSANNGLETKIHILPIQQEDINSTKTSKQSYRHETFEKWSKESVELLQVISYVTNMDDFVNDANEVEDNYKSRLFKENEEQNVIRERLDCKISNKDSANMPVKQVKRKSLIFSDMNIKRESLEPMILHPIHELCTEDDVEQGSVIVYNESITSWSASMGLAITSPSLVFQDQESEEFTRSLVLLVDSTSRQRESDDSEGEWLHNQHARLANHLITKAIGEALEEAVQSQCAFNGQVSPVYSSIQRCSIREIGTETLTEDQSVEVDTNLAGPLNKQAPTVFKINTPIHAKEADMKKCLLKSIVRLCNETEMDGQAGESVSCENPNCTNTQLNIQIVLQFERPNKDA